MEKAIKNLHNQFLYVPKIENVQNFRKFKKFLICGMGGSALAGGLFKIADPKLDITVHKNYGLPTLSDEEIKSRLIIASSYSGDTEETVSSLKEAQKKKLPIAVICVGGELLKLAVKYNLPHVII